MAAATITNRKMNRTSPAGRSVIGTFTFANNGDTLTVPGVKQLWGYQLEPTANTAFGFTISGNVMTLVSGGAAVFNGSIVGL
jgi:hypothetical protein